MKNSNVSMDRSNLTNGCKKFKRRVRDSVKREEKRSHDSKKSIASVEPKLGELFGKIGEKKLQPFDPSGEYIREPDILNTALDMKLYTLPPLTRNETETPLWSISETPVKNRNDTASLQVSVFDNQQTFTKYCTPQSRILLCQGSESSFCSSSRGSYLHNSVDPTDLLRKRSEEQSVGVVTEIKGIQQTRRLLANARERTRVHTISAAFEALRKQSMAAPAECLCSTGARRDAKGCQHSTPPKKNRSVVKSEPGKASYSTDAFTLLSIVLLKFGNGKCFGFKFFLPENKK